MKHTKTEKGGIIVWDKNDWPAGLGPQGSFSLTQYLTQVDANGFMRTTNIDPFRVYGTLAPGFAPGSNATNSGSLGGVVVSFDLISDTVGYGIDAGGKVQSVDVVTNTISTTSPFPHTITGTSPVGQDSILYAHNSGGAQVTSWFYSYYNNANWNIGARVNLAGTPDDDFMSTVPATPLDITSGDGDDATQKTAPHPMEVGADGILYIGSGRYLHAYDGNTPSGSGNGTFYSQVLKLPQGFQIQALKKYQNIFTIVGNYYSTGTSTGVGECLMYTWDYSSADVSAVIPLEDFYVSTLFLWNGSPAVITQGVPGRNGKNKIKVISGNQVTTIADFDGNIPFNRGVVVLNDIIYMNAGGKILSFGNRFKSSRAINHLYSASLPGISGALLYADIITGFVISSSSGTPCFNTIYSNNGMGSGEARSYFVDPEFPYNKTGRVTSVIVKFNDVLAADPANGALTLVLNINNSTSQSLIISGLSSLALPLDKRYTQVTSGGKLPSFSTLGWSASWSASSGGSGSLAPVIARIEIEYEVENLPITI